MGQAAVRRPSRPRDENDPFGSDPDVGGGIGSEVPASGVGSGAWTESTSGFGSEPSEESPGEQAGEGNRPLLAQCLALAPAGVPEKEQFCR
jgi:hypothetical protein